MTMFFYKQKHEEAFMGITGMDAKSSSFDPIEGDTGEFFSTSYLVRKSRFKRYQKGQKNLVAV